MPLGPCYYLRMTRLSRGTVLLVLLVLVLVALVIHVGVGAGQLYLGDVFHELFRGNRDGESAANTIIWQLRLPRALGCVMVGALLGTVGSAFQALFRNPLAEPYIVGVSSGAAVGGTLALVLGFGSAFGGIGTMAAGFVTGMLALLLVFGLSRRRGVVDVESLLLSGVTVGAMLGSLVTLIITVSGQNPMLVLRWLLGSMTPMPWMRVMILTVVFVTGGLLLFAQTRRLNAFAIGEETAAHLGVDVRRLKGVVLVTGTAMVAAAVGAVGVIGFLGLAAPHLARRLLSVDWRWSLAGSAIVGSLILLISDLLAQRAVSGAELPVGVVTAIIGAPFLLGLLRRGG